MITLDLQRLLRKVVLQLVYYHKRPDFIYYEEFSSWHNAFFFAADRLDSARFERNLSQKNYYKILKKYKKRYHELPKTLKFDEEDAQLFEFFFDEGTYFVSEEMTNAIIIVPLDKYRKL